MARCSAWASSTPMVRPERDARAPLALSPHRLEQLVERLAHDPRDLHLGDAEATADLVLIQVVLEAKSQDGALARVQGRLGGGELGLDPVIAWFHPPHPLHERRHVLLGRSL